jgi:hypothetical protein
VSDKEIIKNISLVDNDNLGYTILTNKRSISILIHNHPQCCENWGRLSTEDEDLTKFIGHELVELNITQADTHTTFVKDLANMKIECGEYEFITLKTDKSVLQFAVYDEHNGEYGHSIYIEVEPL